MEDNGSSLKNKGIIFYWLSHQEVEYIIPAMKVNWLCDLLGLRLGKYDSFSSHPFGMLPYMKSWPARDIWLGQDESEDILSHLTLGEPLDNYSHVSGPRRKLDWFSHPNYWPVDS